MQHGNYFGLPARALSTYSHRLPGLLLSGDPVHYGEAYGNYKQKKDATNSTHPLCVFVNKSPSLLPWVG